MWAEEALFLISGIVTGASKISSISRRPPCWCEDVAGFRWPLWWDGPFILIWQIATWPLGSWLYDHNWCCDPPRPICQDAWVWCACQPPWYGDRWSGRSVPRRPFRIHRGYCTPRNSQFQSFSYRWHEVANFLRWKGHTFNIIIRQHSTEASKGGLCVWQVSNGLGLSSLFLKPDVLGSRARCFCLYRL